MKNSEMISKDNKAVTYIRSIILIGLTLISAMFFFDEIPTNDYIGWSTLIIFWIFNYFFDVIENKKNGEKKSLILNFLLLAIGLGLLIWQSLSVLDF
ncbi:hypothetical protein QTG56_24990 (plasmid) [Rossellomorea sp. AcN35-11]|nr:hypothetical protein [Rossellomorea aquimaris]WJV31890.1 hypothetical protein QTG56_24990 [Rossellomorea sp. AcN35-11]